MPSIYGLISSDAADLTDRCLTSSPAEREIPEDEESGGHLEDHLHPARADEGT